MAYRTKEQLAGLAEKFIELKASGESALSISKRYSMHFSGVHRLLKQEREGYFDGVTPSILEDPEPFQAPEFNDICGMITDDINGDSIKPDTPRQLKLVVYSHEQSAGSVEITIDVPEIDDLEQYEIEVQKRILAELFYTLPSKPFTLATE